VTSFFRDPEAFAALEEQAIPRLFERRPAGATIRVWAPGCSTGEEAYSLAMLLQERAEALKQSYKVQVFATDIDRQAIEQARAGVYPASIATDITPERLARFFSFEPDGNTYRIHKSTRDLLVFSEQDVIQDPPFSKLDLISCRNLLIYLGAELQKRLVGLFHYALNPGGYLFLGTSETVGEYTNLFVVVDRKSKLYQRKQDGRGVPGPAVEFPPSLTPKGISPALTGRPAEPKVPLRELTERALLLEFAPVGALVDERGEILYLHGRTGYYLEPTPGEAGMNILRMAREGLRREMSSALHSAATHHEPVRHPGLRVKTNGDYATIDLSVRPLATTPETAGAPELYLVTFAPVAAAHAERPDAAAPGATVPDVDARIATLTQELRAKDEYLQTTLEEMETSGEELKSSNEEMQSVNEELQSTNEELETSKEELQAVNEELATVNAELQQRVVELTRANNDMNNLLAATEIGTIFVDLQLRIQRYTPAVTLAINLIQSDVGRPLGHIASNLVGYGRLVADVQAVLDSLVPQEVEVQTQAGVWFLLRIRPYRTLANVIEGAVITFTEMTEVIKARAAVQSDRVALHRLAVVVRDAYDALTVQDMQGRIQTWNPAAERLYGWTEAEALELNVRDLVPEERRQEELAVVQRLARAEVLKPYQTQRIAKGGRIVEVWLTATALANAAGETYAIATTEREATAL
jgi:two-component system CheB/CheR fusion protein